MAFLTFPILPAVVFLTLCLLFLLPHCPHPCSSSSHYDAMSRQFWDARIGADTYHAKQGPHDWCTRRWKAGWLLAGWGIADDRVKRGQRQKTVRKQQELKDSNRRLQTLMITNCWICCCNILFLHVLICKGKKTQPFVMFFDRSLELFSPPSSQSSPFYFSFMEILQDTPASVLSCPAFSLRQALDACPAHTVRTQRQC